MHAYPLGPCPAVPSAHGGAMPEPMQPEPAFSIAPDEPNVYSPKVGSPHYLWWEFSFASWHSISASAPDGLNRSRGKRPSLHHGRRLRSQITTAWPGRISRRGGAPVRASGKTHVAEAAARRGVSPECHSINAASRSPGPRRSAAHTLPTTFSARSSPAPREQSPPAPHRPHASPESLAGRNTGRPEPSEK